MQYIEITEHDFDALLDKLENIEMLWYSEHKPKPQTEEEKRILKKVTKIINQTIKIV